GVCEGRGRRREDPTTFPGGCDYFSLPPSLVKEGGNLRELGQERLGGGERGSEGTTGNTSAKGEGRSQD
ncbi:MAG: hypothetical protein ACK56I_01460, partial [bacterium]